jgi:hypothetical protein
MPFSMWQNLPILLRHCGKILTGTVFARLAVEAVGRPIGRIIIHRSNDGGVVALECSVGHFFSHVDVNVKD